MGLSLRSLIVVSLSLVTTASFASTEFPFTLNRSADGRISTIELPESLLDTEEDALTELRYAISRVEERGFGDEYSSTELNPDERAVFEKAKSFLAKGLKKEDVDDPRLDTEFAKAKLKLNALRVYRLLASPYAPAAFDQENVTKATIKGILDAAKLVFAVAPPYHVFEFLVDQHLDNLESRRVFHQNRLLVWMDAPASLISLDEASVIRSSIHYSRIPLYDTKTRKAARASWATYGDDRTRSLKKKCVGFASSSETTFGPCFKISGQEIRNGLVRYSITSKKSSLAFDYANPSRVRNGRIGWFALKLGLKFVPAPMILKKGVSVWIGSHYVEQRNAEGYLYQSARMGGQTSIASWVAYGSANPVLNAN